MKNKIKSEYVKHIKQPYSIQTGKGKKEINMVDATFVAFPQEDELCIGFSSRNILLDRLHNRRLAREIAENRAVALASKDKRDRLLNPDGEIKNEKLTKYIRTHPETLAMFIASCMEKKDFSNLKIPPWAMKFCEKHEGKEQFEKWRTSRKI